MQSRLVGPRFLEPHVAKRIAPTTLYRYQAAALAFTAWAGREGYAPSTVEEWDDLLVEYLYENGHILTRSKFQSVVAAAEYFFPLLRRKLAWCHQVIDGWNVEADIHHTVPLGKGSSKLVAMHMSSLGYARLGVGCVLQAHTGLRPGELLAIVPRDILFPEDQGRHLKDMPASIALGTKKGTKVKRPQFVLLDHRLELIVALLRIIVRMTPAHMRLFPYSQSLYRKVLARVQSDLGLQLGWTPHSPRAGFASDSRTEGWTFEEVREAGRWSSDSSLRTYLDIIGSANIATALRARGLSPALRYAAVHWTSYFPPEALARG